MKKTERIANIHKGHLYNDVLRVARNAQDLSESLTFILSDTIDAYFLFLIQTRTPTEAQEIFKECADAMLKQHGMHISITDPN